MTADLDRPDLSGLSRRPPHAPVRWRQVADCVWGVAVGLPLLNLVVGVGAPGPVRFAVALPLLVLLPGWCTARLLGTTRPAGWDAALHVVAYGLFWLLAISFAVAVIPVAGALSTVGCLVGFDVTVALLAAGVVHKGRRCRVGIRVAVPRLRLSRADVSSVAAVVLAAAAVILVVAGAARLNAGGGSAVTQVALAAVAAAVLLVMVPAREHWVPTTLFLVGLAVLFATSLRGSGVTGHDIKIEFRVFQDTLLRGGWEAGGIAPDYNACLSLTTLPSFLCRLLGVAPIDVFRVAYQLIFAVVPVGVYLVARRWLSVRGAAAAGALFVAFPTFVNDLPMLNRQGMALVFFTVMILALFDERDPPAVRRWTFCVAAAGLTVSHYTSTYVSIAILGAGWVVLRMSRSTGNGLLTWRLVVVVLLFATGWSWFSGSGGGLARTARATLVAVVDHDRAYSDAVGYSLLRSPGAGLTDEQALQKYVDDRAVDGPAPAAVDCPTRFVPPDTLPVTGAGRALERAHISPVAVSAWSRRAAVVLFMGGAVIGLVLMAVRWRRSPTADRTLVVLAGSAMGALAATVVVPYLSVSYPLTRLYQQSLVLFAPLIVLAVTTPLRALGERRAQLVGAVVVTSCFVSTSGLLPQLLGGYQPQLNLNNAGQYHRAWYVSADDVEAMRWLDTNLPRGAQVAMDSADTARLRGMTQRDAVEGGVPGTVPATAYVQVTVTRTGEAQAVVVVGDRILLVRYPRGCVTAGRPLLNVTGQRWLYGPRS